MADARIVLIGLMTLLTCAAASSSSYFNYPGNFPIVVLADFKYIPTDYGYMLSYRTQAGVTHQELGIVPGVPPALRNNDNSNNFNSDTLGSSRVGRQKSKRLPSKSRKVSPKLLASLSG